MSNRFLLFIIFIIINVLLWALKFEFLVPNRVILIPLSILFLFFSLIKYSHILNKIKPRCENFLDPTYIFSIFLLLYIISPGLILLFSLEAYTPIGWIGLNEKDLIVHYYRMILFFISVIFFVSIGKNYNNKKKQHKVSVKNEDFILNILIILYLICLYIIEYFAKPIDNYYEFYVRHEHLSGIPKLIVLAAKRLYWGLSPFLLYYFALKFKVKIYKYVIIVVFLCLIDLVYSHGSRINTLLMVIQAFLSMRFINNQESKISFAKILICSIFAGLLMLLVEEFRLTKSEVNVDEKVSMILSMPGELIALYFPSIHINELVNTNNSISKTLFIEEIFKIIPFAGMGEQNLMYWYWKNFHPDSIVAPYTMGVLANAALLGDIWLIIECFFIAICLIFIDNLVRNDGILQKITGIYFISISVLVMKYGVIAYIDQYIKNLFPLILIIIVLNKIMSIKKIVT